jgi:hypothetical protein
MIFIGGIQPKTKTLDNHPRTCPSCGLDRAYLKRTDHYFSLFFIPLIRVSRGKPFLAGEVCGGIFDEQGRGAVPGRLDRRRCPGCGERIEPSFRYCPYCGRTQ